MRKKLIFGAILFVILSVEIVFTVAIPMWREGFYNILQKKDLLHFNHQLWYLVALLGGLSLVQSFKQYMCNVFSFEWRRPNMLDLRKRLMRYVRRNKQLPDNYGQAIAEATRWTTSNYVIVWAELIISGGIVIGLLAQNYDKPMLMGASVAYSVLTLLIAKFFNRPLTRAQHEIQSAEGKYRDNMGLWAKGGEYTGKTDFRTFISKYYLLIRTNLNYTLFMSGQSTIANLAPYILIGPLYFASKITLGDFMAQVSIFELLVINLTVFRNLYPELAVARGAQAIIDNFRRATDVR